MIKRSVKKILGFGTDLPRKAQTFIDRDGDTKITSLKVVRAPINDVISKFLNIISLGMFKTLQNKLGYDRFYHLSLVVNDATRIEKNEQIKIAPYRDEQNEEFLQIPLKGKSFTIKQLMDNGMQQMGEKFIPYNALTNNCQDFIIGLLRGSGLSSQGIESFVKQPIDQLVDNLPNYVKTTTNLITSIGGLLTYLRELTGFKQGGIISDDTPEIIRDLLNLENN